MLFVSEDPLDDFPQFSGLVGGHRILADYRLRSQWGTHVVADLRAAHGDREQGEGALDLGRLEPEARGLCQHGLVAIEVSCLALWDADQVSNLLEGAPLG